MKYCFCLSLVMFLISCMSVQYYPANGRVLNTQKTLPNSMAKPVAPKPRTKEQFNNAHNVVTKDASVWSGSIMKSRLFEYYDHSDGSLESKKEIHQRFVGQMRRVNAGCDSATRVGSNGLSSVTLKGTQIRDNMYSVICKKGCDNLYFNLTTKNGFIPFTFKKSYGLPNMFVQSWHPVLQFDFYQFSEGKLYPIDSSTEVTVFHWTQKILSASCPYNI